MGRANLKRPKRMGAADTAGSASHEAGIDASDQAPDRSQLEQIIAGLSEGVILIEPDQTITYANEAALEMHGVTSLDELGRTVRSEEHTSELQSRQYLVCRLLLEKKNTTNHFALI